MQTGSVFAGRYEIVRCLRAGGMGAVYEVVDQKTRRRRALKVMLPALADNAGFREQFRKEATVTADIDSDHIVEIFDADVDAASGSPFLVMELLRGDDLGRVIEQQRAISPADACELLRQAALALDRTHAAGIVHRDIKPENLFLGRSDDGAPKLKILDFGIAKVVESSAEARATRTIGTPLYMAPEQIRGDGRIGPQADLFALAHIAYALLSSEAYWAEDAAETTAVYMLFSRILLGSREPPSVRALRRRQVSLPPAFDVWFSRATALDPAQRFEDAGDMIKHLRAALAVASGAHGDLGRIAASPAPVSSEPPRAVTPIPAAEAPATRISGPHGTSFIKEPNRTTGALASDRRSSEIPVSKSHWPLLVALMMLVGALVCGTLALRRAASPADVVVAASPATVEEPKAPTADSASPPVTTAPMVTPVDVPTGTTEATSKPSPPPVRRVHTPVVKPVATPPPLPPAPVDPTRVR